jgi:hypothetical protein
LEAEDPEGGVGADPTFIEEDPNMLDLDAEIDDGLDDADDGALDFDKGKHGSHRVLRSLLILSLF